MEALKAAPKVVKVVAQLPPPNLSHISQSLLCHRLWPRLRLQSSRTLHRLSLLRGRESLRPQCKNHLLARHGICRVCTPRGSPPSPANCSSSLAVPFTRHERTLTVYGLDTWGGPRHGGMTSGQPELLPWTPLVVDSLSFSSLASMFHKRVSIHPPSPAKYGGQQCVGTHTQERVPVHNISCSQLPASMGLVGLHSFSPIFGF